MRSTRTRRRTSRSCSVPSCESMRRRPRSTHSRAEDRIMQCDRGAVWSVILTSTRFLYDCVVFKRPSSSQRTIERMTQERRCCSIHDVFQGGQFLCHRCQNSWSTRRNRISRQNSGADSHSCRRDSDSAGSGATGRNLKAFSPRTGFNCFVSFSHCCVLHVVSTVKMMKNYQFFFRASQRLVRVESSSLT